MNWVFWTKAIFIVACFFEGFLCGIFPTISRDCRENPKILGVANAFACGVFLAIALIHILPEEAGEWTALHPNATNLFPLPYLLVFLGYTLILFVDKVAFDSSALTRGDPAMKKLSKDIADAVRSGEASPENAVERAIEDYNNPQARIAKIVKKSYGNTDDEESPLLIPAQPTPKTYSANHQSSASIEDVEISVAVDEGFDQAQ